MQTIIDTIRGLGVTSYLAFGFIGFEMLGGSVLLLMFIIFMIAGLIDIYLGCYISKRYQLVRSKNLTDGVVSKLTKWVITAMFIILIAHVSYLTKGDMTDLILALVGLGLIGLLFYGEAMSLVENLILIDDGKNKVVLEVLAKIMGIGYDYVQSKLNNKVRQIVPLAMQEEVLKIVIADNTYDQPVPPTTN